jgi:hypothetical protein
MQERLALPKGKKRFARLRKIAEATELSLGARLLAHVLDLHFMNRKTGACFPAHETLAAVLGVNEKTVRRYLDELRGAGWGHLVVWQGHGKTAPP